MGGNGLWGLRDGVAVRLSDWQGEDDWVPRPADSVVGCDETTGRFHFVLVDRPTDTSSLWVSEGTESTTRKVLDFPALLNGDRTRFHESDSGLLLRIPDRRGQTAFWTLDDTGALDPIVIGDELQFSAIFEGQLIFVRREADRSWTLNAYDFESFEETVLVESGITRGSSDLFAEFTEINGALYFTLEAAPSSHESRNLWVTDGTAAGSKQLTKHGSDSIQTGILGVADDVLITRDWRLPSNTFRYHETLASERREVAWSIEGLTQGDPGVTLGDRLYFSGSVQGEPQLIEVTREGNVSSARMLDVPSVVASGQTDAGYPMLLAAMDRVWFAAIHPVYGYEVFYYDPDSDRSYLTQDINSTEPDRHLPFATVRDGSLLYQSNAEIEALTLSRYDPATGVERIDIANVTERPYLLTASEEGDFYFNTVWRFDLTGRTATRIVDLPGRIRQLGIQGSDKPYVTLGGRLLFAREFQGRVELWSTANRAGSAIMLIPEIAEDFVPMKAGELAYVLAGDSRREIVQTDGTFGGTRTFYQEPEDALRRLFIRDQRVGYLVVDAIGDEGGTLIFDLVTGKVTQATEPEGLRSRRYRRTLDEGVLYDAVFSGESDRSFWLIPYGQPMMQRLTLGSPGDLPDVLGEPIHVDGTTYFVGRRRDEGHELWAMKDRTMTRLTDIYPGRADGLGNTELAHIGTRLYFCGNDGSSGFELYSYDIITGNILLESDLNTGLASSSPREFHVLADQLYFWATSDASKGLGLHSFDPVEMDVTGESTLRWFQEAGTLHLEIHNRSSSAAQLYHSADMLQWQRSENGPDSPRVPPLRSDQSRQVSGRNSTVSSLHHEANPKGCLRPPHLDLDRSCWTC